jgi:hypothetical protein
MRLITGFILFFSSMGFAEYVSRDLVVPIDGWDCLYYTKTQPRAVCANTADGRIARVTLSGELGFEGGAGVKLEAGAIQALASMYEPWISSDQPPAENLKKQLDHACRRARTAVGVPYDRGMPAASTSKPSVKKVAPKHLKMELDAHFSAEFYHALKNLKPVKSEVPVAEFGKETILTKSIAAENFRLKASYREKTGDYKVVIETWDNPNSLNHEGRQIMEGKGEFARQLHAAMFDGFLNTFDYPQLGVELPPKRDDKGIATWEREASQYMDTELGVRFRLHQQRVLMHIELTTDPQLLLSEDDFLYSVVPKLRTASEFGNKYKRVVDRNFNLGPYGAANR